MRVVWQCDAGAGVEAGVFARGVMGKVVVDAVVGSGRAKAKLWRG